MASKPTKQQVAQAKARAGGNNPVKVTNAGLKKLGSAAVIAASFTPAGRAVKTAKTAAKTAGTIAKEIASSPKVVRKIQAKQMVKQTKKNVNAIADIQQKVKAEKIAKNSVKTIPAGNKPRTKTASELAELNKNVKKGKAYSSGTLKKKGKK